MKASYIEKNGAEKPFYMGCYGIVISRTLDTIYERSIIKDKVKTGEVEIENTKTGKKITVPKRKVIEIIKNGEVKKEINELSKE